MKTITKRTISVASYEELADHSYYLRLWMAIRNVEISRRSWLDELANTFRDFDGNIVTEYGQPYEIPCIDEVFGDDPDLRWLSYFMMADTTGMHPKFFSRKFTRLQLLDLYFRIRHPNISRHFSR
jgi:hypothetical protein